MARYVYLAPVFVWLSACSAAATGETPVEPESPQATEGPDAGAVASVEAPTPPAVTTTGGPPVDDSRELTSNDCRQLALKYGDVLRADEIAKLPPNLTEGQRSAAMKGMNDVSRKLEERWETSCSSDLVGKSQSEAVLQCVMRSKSVAGFEACLAGQAPPAK